MPSGYPDVKRPERIAEAAVAVVAERGVEGLTHRAVAAAANLPLGSTTYHFSSIDDLLSAAIRHAKESEVQRLDAWEAELGEAPDLAAALGRLLVHATGPDRARIVVEYELYLAALRRPALRPLAYEWYRALPDALTRRTDLATAIALATMFDGLAVRSLISGERLSEEEVEPLLRRVTEGGARRRSEPRSIGA